MDTVSDGAVAGPAVGCDADDDPALRISAYDTPPSGDGRRLARLATRIGWLNESVDGDDGLQSKRQEKSMDVADLMDSPGLVMVNRTRSSVLVSLVLLQTRRPDGQAHWLLRLRGRARSGTYRNSCSVVIEVDGDRQDRRCWCSRSGRRKSLDPRRRRPVPVGCTTGRLAQRVPVVSQLRRRPRLDADDYDDLGVGPRLLAWDG